MSRRPVLRFLDIYHEFVAPKLAPRRDDWDNLSQDVLYLDPAKKQQQQHYPSWQEARAKKTNNNIQVSAVEKNAHRSFEDCARLCDATNDCFQFSYHDGACAYHRSFRLGKPAKKSDRGEQQWTSGWNVERIRAWIGEQKPCGEPAWPLAKSA